MKYLDDLLLTMYIDVMAKIKNPIADIAALLKNMDGMADQLKASINKLVDENKKIDAEAAAAKAPNNKLIAMLNERFSKLTGKSYMKGEAVSPSMKKGYRGAEIMEEFAKQVHTAISKSKEGMTSAELRDAIPGLQPTDNITVLLKRFKLAFKTTGPKKTMKYIAA